MDDKILNIIAFIIAVGLTIIITPIVTLLVFLFGSFVLAYFIIRWLYEKIFRKPKNIDYDET